jgi:hypothetical protein
MAKVLFLIISGKEAPQKAELGIIVAARSVLAKRYEDLKVIFFSRVHHKTQWAGKRTL